MDDPFTHRKLMKGADRKALAKDATLWEVPEEYVPPDPLLIELLAIWAGKIQSKSVVAMAVVAVGKDGGIQTYYADPTGCSITLVAGAAHLQDKLLGSLTEE